MPLVAGNSDPRTPGYHRANLIALAFGELGDPDAWNSSAGERQPRKAFGSPLLERNL